jgi:hypothetical protein
VVFCDCDSCPSVSDRIIGDGDDGGGGSSSSSSSSSRSCCCCFSGGKDNPTVLTLKHLRVTLCKHYVSAPNSVPNIRQKGSNPHSSV